jgi:tetratricopeptide (TPR) repeat protein
LLNYVEEAWERAEEGDPSAAVKIMERNFRRADRGFGYYFFHGLFTRAQGYQKYGSLALESFMRAYKIAPDIYEINDFIGSTLAGIGRYEEAIPFLERAFELHTPEIIFSLPYWFLAEAYLHVGKLEEAFKINAMAIEEDASPFNYLQRGIILSHFEDVQTLKDNIEIAGEMVTERSVHMELYFDAVKLAQEIMSRGIDINEITDIEVELGLELLRLRVLIENFEIARGMARNIEQSELHHKFAYRIIQMGFPEKAYQLYESWLVGSEAIADWIYFGMGYILMLNGDWEKSIEMLRKAESIYSDLHNTKLYLSFYYFFTGDLKRAFEYEALARSYLTHLTRIPRKRSADEFVRGYENNWEFQKLLERHRELVALKR